MLAGEALGAAAIGELRAAPVRWGGAWAAGVRPGQGLRPAGGAAMERAERPEGSKIR